MIAASGCARRMAALVARARAMYSAGFSRGSQKLARFGSFHIFHGLCVAVTPRRSGGEGGKGLHFDIGGDTLHPATAVNIRVVEAKDEQGPECPCLQSCHERIPVLPVELMALRFHIRPEKVGAHEAKSRTGADVKRRLGTVMHGDPEPMAKRRNPRSRCARSGLFLRPHGPGHKGSGGQPACGIKKASTVHCVVHMSHWLNKGCLMAIPAIKREGWHHHGALGIRGLSCRSLQA